jgi:hypothetical protein
MIRNGLIVVLMMGFGFIVLAVTLPDIMGHVEAARTNAATEIDVCTTNANGDCVIGLSAAHANSDSAGLFITETSPGSGDRSSNGELQSNLQTINMSGLTALTAYTFTLDYLVVDANVSGSLNQLLTAFPILLVVGLLGLALFAAWRANSFWGK